MYKNKRVLSLLLVVLTVLSGINLTSFELNKVYAAGPSALLKDLPEGTLVYDPGWKWQHKLGVLYSDENQYYSYVGNGQYKSVIWIVAAHNHYANPAQSVTLMTNEIIAKYPYHTSREVTSWSGSSLRPWLNSTFYNSFSVGFKGQVLSTSVPNINYSSFNPSKGSASNTTDNVFIPSETELGGPATGAYKVGVKWDYFNTAATRIARLGGVATNYWVRTPLSSVDFYMRYALSNGNFAGVSPLEGSRVAGTGEEVGVRAVLNLDPNTVVYANESDYVPGSLVLGGLPSGYSQGEFFPEPEQPDDIIPPTGDITASTESWTNQDVTLYVNAADETALKSITTPDGAIIENEDALGVGATLKTYDFPRPLVVNSQVSTANGIFPKNKTIEDYNFTIYEQDIPTIAELGYKLVNRYFVRYKFGNYGLDLVDLESNEYARLYFGSSDVNWVKPMNDNARIIKAISDENYIFVGQHYKFIYSDEVINRLIRYNVKTGKVDVFNIATPGVNSNDESKYVRVGEYNYILGDAVITYFKSGSDRLESVQLNTTDKYTYGNAVRTEDGKNIIVYTARSGYLPHYDFSVFNTETNTVEIVQYQDITGPTMTISVDNVEGTTDGVLLTAEATDVSGVRKITTPDGEVVFGNIAAYQALTNGVYEFKAEDTKGNISTLSYTVGNVVDISSDREIDIVGNTTEPTYQVKLEVTVKDKSAIESIRVNGEKAGFVYIVDRNGVYNFSIIDRAGREVQEVVEITNIDDTLDPINLSIEYTVETNGVYIFKATDTTGNETLLTYEVSNIDKINPIIRLDKDENGEIIVEAEDNQSGVDKVYYSIDNGEWFEDGAVIGSLPEGNYIIGVKVVDKAGNESEESIDYVVEIEEVPEEPTEPIEDTEPSEPEDPEMSDGEEVPSDQESLGHIVVKYLEIEGIEVKEEDNIDVPLEVNVLIEAPSLMGFRLRSNAYAEYFLTSDESLQEHTFEYEKDAPVSQKPEVPVVDSVKEDNTEITGSAEPGTKVEVTLPNGEVVDTITNEDGKFIIELPEGVELKEGDTLEVKVVDIETGEESETVVVTVEPSEPQKPKAPEVETVKEGDKEIVGTAEPGTKVEVTLPNGEVIETVVDEDGKFIIELPEGVELKEGDTLEVKVLNPETGAESDTVVIIVEPKEPVVGDNALEEATKAVEKAEDTRTQEDVDKARDLVGKLPEGEDKDNLNKRLDEIQKEIDAKKEKEEPTNPGSGSGGSGGGSNTRPPREDKEPIKVEDTKEYKDINSVVLSKIPYTILKDSKVDWNKVTGVSSTKLKVELDTSKVGRTQVKVTILGKVTEYDIEVVGLVENQDALSNIPQNHWAKEYAVRAVNKGYIIGALNGDVMLNNTLTVADSFTAYDRLLLAHNLIEMRLDREIVDGKTESVKDTWYTNPVKSILSKYTKETGLDQIKSSEMTRPIRREEIAQILYNSLKGVLVENQPMIDYKDIMAADNYDAIVFCTKVGILVGYNGEVNPKGYLTRAEFMTILVRVDSLIQEQIK